MIRLQLREREYAAACCAMDRYRFRYPSFDSRLRALWRRFILASVFGKQSAEGKEIAFTLATARLLRRTLRHAVCVVWNDPTTPQQCAAVLAKLERGMK